MFTAEHVIHGAPKGSITLRTHGNGEVEAQVVAVDPGHDLALLRVPEKKEGAAEQPFLEISDKLPDPGDTVFLFGSAYFRHELMIRGAVARKNPTYEYLPNSRHYIKCTHVSAPSPLGTSGGCWLDEKGRVVGLQSAFMSKDGVGMGIAFVIIPDAIRSLLASGRTPERATIGCGLEESLSQPKAFLSRFPVGARGLVPVLHRKGGGAEAAGLTGDVLITHVDGVATPLKDAFLDVVRAKRPGESIKVTVLRPGSIDPSEVEVKLGSL